MANPYRGKPTYDAMAERAKKFRDPEIRRKILAEDMKEGEWNFFSDPAIFDNAYLLGDNPNYEPAPEDSVSAIPRRQGQDVHELTYELLLLPYMNYSNRNCDPH